MFCIKQEFFFVTTNVRHLFDIIKIFFKKKVFSQRKILSLKGLLKKNVFGVLP